MCLVSHLSFLWKSPPTTMSWPPPPGSSIALFGPASHTGQARPSSLATTILNSSANKALNGTGCICHTLAKSNGNKMLQDVTGLICLVSTCSNPIAEMQFFRWSLWKWWAKSTLGNCLQLSCTECLHGKYKAKENIQVPCSPFHDEIMILWSDLFL